MPKFLLSRKETRTILVDAPTRDAAEAYTESDAYPEYLETISSDTTDRIEALDIDSAADLALDAQGVPRNG